MDITSLFVDFSEEEIREFVSKKLTNLKCTTCGQTNFIADYLKSDEYTGVSLGQYTKKMPPNIAGITELIPLTCENCSTVVLLDGRSVQNWVNKNVREKP